MFKMKEICFGVDISSLNASRRVQGNYFNHIGVRSRRGGLAIVAASPPTEDAVVAAEPLTKEDLIGYLASGCKSKEKWRFEVRTFLSVLKFQLHIVSPRR